MSFNWWEAFENLPGMWFLQERFNENSSNKSAALKTFLNAMKISYANCSLSLSVWFGFQYIEGKNNENLKSECNSSSKFSHKEKKCEKVGLLFCPLSLKFIKYKVT